MTEYKAVLSGNPDPNVPNHIVMVCVWDTTHGPGLGDELVRLDTGIAEETTTSYDMPDVKEIAEEKLSSAGWLVGPWEESGGDWYATATATNLSDDQDAILDRFNPGRTATPEQ